MLDCENFSLTFTPTIENSLIDNVSFKLAQGKTLCIVGESGCGKSVLSMSLMGLLDPRAAHVRSGSIRFEGNDLLTMSPAKRNRMRGKDMAMIFQEPMTSLNPAFTIGDQLIEAILSHADIPRAEASSRALGLLAQVGLPASAERLARYPHQLSGGQRQRVMIAMAIANRPRLLIADEPTTALDVTIQAQVLRLMKELQEKSGSSVILITHDLRVVAEVADLVMVMYAGRVAEFGTVEDVFSDPQHPYTIGLFGSTPGMVKSGNRLDTIEGSVPPLENMPKGCRFAPRCPFSDARCHAEPPPAVQFSPLHRASCWYAPVEDKGAKFHD